MGGASVNELGRKPHIVHILGTLGAGGAQRVVLQLALNPALQGFRHSVVCIIAKEGEMLESYTSHGIAVHACPLRWSPQDPIPSYRLDRWLRRHLVFTFPWRLTALLRRMGADLVNTHVTTPEIHLQARAIIQMARLPWVWTIRGLYRSRGEDVSAWSRVVGSINRSPAAMITAVSRAALDEVLVGNDMSPHKARVISNGIDLSKFEPQVSPNGHLRAKFRIPAGALVYGTAGRLVEVKRMDVFIDAARCLIEAGNPAHFVIAGDGPLRAALSARIEGSGFKERIHLVGYQADMPAFLHSLDVFVLSSDSEGMPNALLEACASRLPCIATAVGGVPDVLAEEAGILVPPASPSALADAMERMSALETRTSYARRARTAAEKFSLDEMCRTYASLYRDLLTAA